MKFSRLLTAAVISSSGPAVWAGSTVEVVINPTPANEGNIIVALCTPESFPHEERCPVRKVVPAKAAEQAIALSAPAPGRYAVIAVADVNGNSTWDADPGVSGNGGAGDTVLYTASITYTRLFPMSIWMGWSRTATLSASTVLKNQPWAAQASSTPATICT